MAIVICVRSRAGCVRRARRRSDAIKFTVPIDRGIGPEPHPNFVDFFSQAAVRDGYWEVAGAGKNGPALVTARLVLAASPGLVGALICPEGPVAAVATDRGGGGCRTSCFGGSAEPTNG